jgi:hypothetical protein
MRKRNSKNPSALKHGAHSSITLLPGEDEAAFNKLHDGLKEEFAPVGPLEQDIIRSMACLVWRKQNLATFYKVEHAIHRCEAIQSEAIDAAMPRLIDEGIREQVNAASSVGS